jgi:acid phosphatase type 7
VVAGSAGADGGVQSGYPHNALPFSIDDGGMLYFEVEDNRLDAKFIRRDGVIADKFTIVKDVNSSSSVTINSGESTVLTASWTGNYLWSNGEITRSISVSPTTTTNYTCTDGSGCLSEQFTVNVNAQSPGLLKAIQIELNKDAGNWSLYPTPVKRGAGLNIVGSTNSPFTIEMLNEQGSSLQRATAKGKYTFQTANLSTGIYFIRMVENGKRSVKKVMVID